MIESIKQKSQESNFSRLIYSAAMRRIVDYGFFIISDISEDTGISVTTVSKYVSQMVDEGFLEILEKVSVDKRGRTPVLYGISGGRRYFMSVFVKEYELSFGLMDLSMKMVASGSVDFVYENSFAKISEINEKLDVFLKQSGSISRQDLSVICVCLAGRVDHNSGSSASIFLLEELSGTTLTEYFTELFGVRTIIENDTKAMTVGEYAQLRYRSMKNLLFVNMTNGLGVGIVIDGKLFYGKDGYSGEFGHSPVYDNNLLCHCGKYGCLETEVSGRAICRRLVERVKAGEPSKLASRCGKNPNIRMTEIVKAAADGDALCERLISESASELGRHLSTLINIFNPDCIVLGGEFAAAPARCFLFPDQASIKKYSLRLISQSLPVVVSELGLRAGTIGGCMIARSAFLLDGQI